MDSDKHVDAVTDGTVTRRETEGLDRRSPDDRRVAHNLDHFVAGDVERRKWKERRWRLVDLRKGWVRVTDWSSAMVGIPSRRKSARKIYQIDDAKD